MHWFCYTLAHFICIFSIYFIRSNKRKWSLLYFWWWITHWWLLINPGVFFTSYFEFFHAVLMAQRVKKKKTFYRLINFVCYSIPPEVRTIDASFYALMEKNHYSSKEWEVRKFSNCALSVFKVYDFYI